MATRPPQGGISLYHVPCWSSQRGRIYKTTYKGRRIMCVGGLFGGGRKPMPQPTRQAPAPTMQAAAPPPEMVSPEKIKEEQTEDDLLSTKKKKALEIKKWISFGEMSFDWSAKLKSSSITSRPFVMF